jgi:spore maturation protein CgeB
MKLSLFYHSLVSDWNHGNAHFLRGVVSNLLSRGHEVQVFEPADGWSLRNLLDDHGPTALQRFHEAYPRLSTNLYHRDSLDLEQIAADSDVIIVHEWNEPWLVNGLGKLRNRSEMASQGADGFRLLFHDTHHRAVSDRAWLQRFRLEYYDGILAFGDVLSDVYRNHGWHQNVWTWHEAADTEVFYPRAENTRHPRGDLVWIGNWGDNERAAELETFLFRPVRALNLDCRIYGVRYPQTVLQKLRRHGVGYGGWLANFEAPAVFANYKVTVHVPRRYYAETLPGIPTIRPFEAMACGIPLVSAPWKDTEALFSEGNDYLVARDSDEMQKHLKQLLNDRDYALDLASHALGTIRKRHSCTHRVDQLIDILGTLGVEEEIPTTAIPSSARFATASEQRGRAINAFG